MLVVDLQEQLKNMTPDIQTIGSFWDNAHLEKKFQELSTLSQEEDFWKNPQQTDILKELQQIKSLREQYLSIITSHKDLIELVDLFAEKEDELTNIAKEITDLRKKVTSFKVHLLLNQSNDSANAFVH